MNEWQEDNARVEDLRKAKSELGEMVTEWMLWGAQRRHAWQSARRRAANLRAILARVEALADEWDAEGRGLIDHCESARDVHEGQTLQRCAYDLLHLDSEGDA